MAKQLFIVRNPDSPLLDYLDTDREDCEVVLIQNGVYSKELPANNAVALGIDAVARKVNLKNTANYDEIVQKIFQAEKAVCI